MYAALFTLNLGPDMRPVGEKTADQFFSIIKNLKGFKGATFFGDATAGDYNGLVLWESKEDAEAAYAITGPKIQEALGNILKAPPTRRIYDVYEPKG
jgi:heme-degrading monooxygenase HmoA